MKNGESAATLSAQKTEGKTKVGGMPLYYVYKDGHGFEFKVANMANPVICQRKGIVEVECIRKSNVLEPNFSISTVTDRELGIIFGIPLGIDGRTKEIKWQRFKLGDFKRYDLTKHNDATEWTVVRRAPWLIGSAYQKGKPYYKMHDKEAEARETIGKSKIRRKATDIAEKMISIDELTDMYRNFGNSPEGFSLMMLQAEVMKIAETSPKEFMSIWDNANKSIITVFNRCKETGLITYNAVQATFMWKNSLPMGMTEDAAIKFLIENKSVLNQAQIESEERDYVKKRIKSESKEERIENPQDDDELLELRGIAKIMNIQNYSSMNKEELQIAVDKASEAS